MKDTFTNLFPGYLHGPNSCFTNATSHIIHTKHSREPDPVPLEAGRATYNHLKDHIKMHSEGMYKLGVSFRDPLVKRK